MSDQPLDTPWEDMDSSEIDAMTTEELMERSIATNELGVEGFLDTVTAAAVVETMQAIKAVQMSVFAYDREDPGFDMYVHVLAQQLHAHVEAVFNALVETGRRVGYKEGQEDAKS
jgi:hypothetical protein